MTMYTILTGIYKRMKDKIRQKASVYAKATTDKKGKREKAKGRKKR